MAVEQWQIDNRRSAGWSESEINAWIASQNASVTTYGTFNNLEDALTHGCDFSQPWLCAGYTGPQPTPAVKNVYSDAQYAYDLSQASLARKQAEAAANQARTEADRNAALDAAARAEAALKQLQLAQANKVQTVTGTQQAGTLDLSGINSALQQGINWIQTNLLIVVIVLAAVIFLPSMLGRSVRG